MGVWGETETETKGEALPEEQNAGQNLYFQSKVALTREKLTQVTAGISLMPKSPGPRTAERDNSHEEAAGSRGQRLPTGG